MKSLQIFDQPRICLFSGLDDGLYNLLCGHIPDHRCSPHHPVRHLLQTKAEEEAQLWHQEGQELGMDNI